jgi:diguanylate cyclase (GGDEF)-like protein
VLRDITDYLRAQQSLHVSTRLMEERLEANLRLQEQLHEMAHRDSLTGLNNRRILETIADRLVESADDVGRSLVAISLDLDHFKRLNDTFGHKAGDDALVALATVLARSLRPGEVAVRMGGEEFLVLMPHSDIEEARARAEAWRAVIRAQPVATSQGAAEITFSAGISAYPDTAASFEQMLQQADKAVYAAKRAGRNRVVVARQSTEFGDGRMYST